KIRSMRADAPDGLASGAPISAGVDGRTTPLGRFLRRYRLDELPQLAQVLTGSMALFGPRPEAPEFVTSGSAWRVVLAARPGIAGPTQLLVEDLESRLPFENTAAFYTEHVLPIKLIVDEWYVNCASPSIDARIVVGLLQRFLLRRTPTVLTRYVERQNEGLARQVATLSGQLDGAL
ncbi:MAG: sugar transferase, partial [Gammaproteobacteria bacterium]